MMNREEVARELASVARDLTAADVNLHDEYVKIFKSVAAKVEKTLKGVKGVEKTSRRERDRGKDYTFVVELSGYTRGDLEASGSVYVSFSMGAYKHFVMVDGKRADWGRGSTRLMEMEFEQLVPVDTIRAHVERLFG